MNPTIKCTLHFAVIIFLFTCTQINVFIHRHIDKQKLHKEREVINTNTKTEMPGARIKEHRIREDEGCVQRQLSL